jgi:HK97 gp10 family phage protein
MAGLTISLQGDKQLLAALQQLSQDMQGELLEKALTAGAMIVANDAKRRAPVKTGNLRRSIHIGGQGAGAEGGDIGRPAQPANGAAVQVGTNVEYAAIHEYGGIITPKTAKALRFKIGDKWVMTQRVQIPARPYLRPALDENEAAVKDEVSKALQALIEQAVK